MPGKPQLVIIADDDRDDSLFLLSALLASPRELNIIAVPNGEELINILEVVWPHMVFLYVNMPKKNGFEALQHIRSSECYFHTFSRSSIARTLNLIFQSQKQILYGTFQLKIIKPL